MIRVPECARVSRCLCVISDVMPGRASAPDVVSRIILFTVFTVHDHCVSFTFLRCLFTGMSRVCPGSPRCL